MANLGSHTREKSPCISVQQEKIAKMVHLGREPDPSGLGHEGWPELWIQDGEALINDQSTNAGESA
jgi:hypothetical protein